MRSAKVPRAVAGDGPFCVPPLRSSNVRSSVLGGRLSPCGALSVVTPLPPPSLGPSVRGRARSGENGRTDGRAPSLAPRPRRATVCPSRSPHTQGFPTIFPSLKLCPPEEPTGEAKSVNNYKKNIMSSSSAAAVLGLRRAACLLLM